VKGLRKEFAQEVANTLNAVIGHLKFIDECGVHLGLTRLYGRAAPGQRVVEATLGYSGPNYTLVAALSLNRVSAPWLLEGALNSLAFETYVDQVLAPTLRPGDVVVIDNLSAHKGVAIRATIEARQARVVFLPPYSPDLNPIEKCWAKVKTALRAAKAQTFDALVEAVCDALLTITPNDAAAWFAHCGYASNP
jgi:transposase